MKAIIDGKIVTLKTAEENAVLATQTKHQQEEALREAAPKGLTVDQLAEKLKGKGVITEADITAAVESGK